MFRMGLNPQIYVSTVWTTHRPITHTVNASQTSQYVPSPLLSPVGSRQWQWQRVPRAWGAEPVPSFGGCGCLGGCHAAVLSPSSAPGPVGFPCGSGQMALVCGFSACPPFACFFSPFCLPFFTGTIDTSVYCVCCCPPPLSPLFFKGVVDASIYCSCLVLFSFPFSLHCGLWFPTPFSPTPTAPSPPFYRYRVLSGPEVPYRSHTLKYD